MRSVLLLAVLAVLPFGASACSSNAGTCSAGTAEDGGAIDPCAHDDGGSSGSGSGSGSGSSSGSTSSSSSSGSGSSGSGSGSGSSRGGSGSGSSGSGSGSGGPGSENCQAGQGDFCMCFAPSSGEPANDVPCSPASMQNAGTCCAEPGWPASGNCICSAFLCYVNEGGGRDCFFQDLGGNGAEVPTTSATGTACCVWGAASSGYICSCYDDASLCEGKQSVSSCTIDTVPACSSDVTVGYSQVAACR